MSGIADLRGADKVLPAEVSKGMSQDELEHHPFVTARVPDNNLVADLQNSKARFSGQIAIRGFFMRRM
jgi:hypothetical protein